MADDIRLHCPDCGHDMALPPQRCPHCSQLMKVRQPRGGGRQSSMSPIIVILLLFLLLGPFGFGMLWRNDRFSVRWKIALTIAVSLYTIVVFWWAYDAVMSVLGAGNSEDLQKALQQLQGI